MYRLRTFMTKGQNLARGYQCLSFEPQKGHRHVISGSKRPIWPISAKYYSAPVTAEPFLNGSSTTYMEEMYLAWQEDPKSVHKSWDSYFGNVTRGAPPGQAYTAPPGLASSLQVPVQTSLPAHAATQGVLNSKVIDDHLAVQAIIRSYQFPFWKWRETDKSHDLYCPTPSRRRLEVSNYAIPQYGCPQNRPSRRKSHQSLGPKQDPKLTTEGTQAPVF